MDNELKTWRIWRPLSSNGPEAAVTVKATHIDYNQGPTGTQAAFHIYSDVPEESLVYLAQ